MERLFVLDQNEKVLAVLENKDGSSACPYYDATITEQLNGEFSLEFTTLSNHTDARFVVEGNKIGLWDDGEFLLFEITLADDEHDESMTKTVICEHSAIVELNDDIVRDKRPSNVTADVALSGILTDTVKGGSRWAVGTVASLGTATPKNIYYETIMAGVQKIIEGYKTDYKPRIAIDQNNILRFIDLGPRGYETGRRFEYTKDLKSIKREVDTTHVKTALIGRGRGEETLDENGNPTGGFGRRIDFSNVVWSVANGDPVDKPAGIDYVGDPDALANFGTYDGNGGKEHRIGLFDDPDETDPAVLLSKTWEYLQTINHPRATYSMTVIDLARLTGMDHEKVKIGDTVVVIDREFVPALTIKARIIEIKKVIGQPEKTEIKLGNFRRLFTDEATKIDEIERRVNDRSGIWDTVTDPITNDDFENVVPLAPANVTATGLFKTISVHWLLETDVSIGQYEIYASKIQGFTPDATNLVWKGYSGGYVHDAEVNEQWYFRVRVVNKKGTAGPFSTEVTATTVQIIPDDFNQSKIPEFIDIGIIKQATTPAGTFVTGQLWIDTSKTPNILKRWNGSAWVSMTPTTAGHVGAENAIYKQNTAPTHSAGRLWLDTSVTPNVLYRSTGSAWVKGTPTTAGEVGTYTFTEIDTALNAKASQTEVDTISGTVTNHETRITQTESDITLKASQTSVDDLSGRVSTAETNISANAGEISLRATKTELTNAVNDIDTMTKHNGDELFDQRFANGQSLSPFSSGVFSIVPSSELGMTDGKNLIKTDGTQFLRSDFIPFVQGNPFYMALDIYHKDTTNGTLYVGLEFYDKDFVSMGSNDLAIYSTIKPYTDIPINTWKRFEGYVKPNDEIRNKASYVKVRILTRWYGNTGISYIKNINVKQLGALSHVNKRMSTAESSITQNADQIALRVTKTTYDTDINDATNGLKARMTSAESSITQNAENIELRVEKNGVISSINQSAETITISASKVNIDGDLTVTSGLVRIKEGIITNSMIASTAQIDFAKIANVSITNAMIESVDATKITATTLSAISANLGNVTAGTISGVTIKGTDTIVENQLRVTQTSISDPGVVLGDTGNESAFGVYGIYSLGGSAVGLNTAYKKDSTKNGLLNLIGDFIVARQGVASGNEPLSVTNQVAIRGNATITGQFINESQINASLLNGWANYDVSNYAGAFYWKDKNGIVHIGGMIKPGTTTDGTTIMTLPAGYRIGSAELFKVFGWSNTAGYNGAGGENALCRIYITSAGDVKIYGAGGSYPVNWVSLSRISFKAIN